MNLKKELQSQYGKDIELLTPETVTAWGITGQLVAKLLSPGANNPDYYIVKTKSGYMACGEAKIQRTK